jgi:hypothetical protein
MNQENFAFMKTNKPEDPNSSYESDKKEEWQSWNIPVGKADITGNREDIVIKFNGNKWLLDEEKFEFSEMKKRLGIDWSFAVNSDDSFKKAVTDFELKINQEKN